MLCLICKSELDPVMVVCAQCGSPVSASSKGREVPDWRQQVRETVERHKAKKRRERERREDDARQLSIFPEASEQDAKELEVRRRRAEIRARVEERLSRRQYHTQPLRFGDSKSFPDAGEVSISDTRGGGTAVLTAPELMTDLALADRAHDPVTAEYEPVMAPPAPEEGVDAAVSRRYRLGDPGELDHVEDLELGSPSDRRIDRGLGLPSVEEVSLDDVLATAGSRVVAGLIDVCFVALIQLTLFYLTTHLVAQRLGALPSSALVAMGTVGVAMASGYFLFFWSLSGQTLGKLIAGGRVVDRDGRPLGVGRAVVRLSGAVLALLPLGAGFIGLWSDSERRGWHDRLASSKVVQV